MFNFRSQEGQTLIEVVAGIGLLVIVVTALIGMGIVALKTSTSARNRTVAAKLASEEVELVRAFRDSTDSGKGFSNLSCVAQCYINTSTLIVAGTETVQTIFTRYFTVTNVSAGKKKIDAFVSWTESSGAKSVSVTSY